MAVPPREDGGTPLRVGTRAGRGASPAGPARRARLPWPALTVLLAMGLVAGCAGSAPAVSGTARSAAQAGCASWPAGSTGTVLLITAGSDGQSYCVRRGQTVRVLLAGPRALGGGSEPRLTGNALAVAPPQAQLPRMPSVSYTAVRPGTAVLIIVRLPCRAVQPAHGAADAECAMRQAVRVTITVT